jgi:hypothetical protein
MRRGVKDKMKKKCKTNLLLQDIFSVPIVISTSLAFQFLHTSLLLLEFFVVG